MLSKKEKKLIPKISVIIPCYGVEKYLDRCLNSVVNQTFTDIEIILVDDKSPDRVPEMCDDWANKDSRIKVIHKKKNEGLGYARNSGLDVAQGEYIIFLDSDDYVEIEMFEKLYTKAVETNSDIVYCGMKQELSKGVFIETCDFNKVKTFKTDGLQNLSIRYFDPSSGRKLIMSVWHSIYSRAVIGNLRFYSEREVCSEDLPFQIAVIQKSSKVTYIPDTLYYYCLNDTSLSHTFNFDKCFKYFTLANKITDYYSERQKKHVWSFFFMSCQNFIRGLVTTNISYNEKIICLKKLCNNEEIINCLKNYKDKISKTKMSRLYHYCLLNNNVLLLYIIAKLDVHIVCNKLGLKKWI